MTRRLRWNPKASDDSEKTAETETQTDPAEELKVIVSIKEGRAIVGVQQPIRTRTSRRSKTSI